MTDPAIVQPRTATEMAAFRDLNWAYRDFLLSLPGAEADMARAAYPEARYRAVLDAAEVENRPLHARADASGSAGRDALRLRHGADACPRRCRRKPTA